ncbi:MAG TPA: MFS transporter [Anaerolineaceae bacterium]|nr:MFS transporter [Anaerolineaceae bacterium]HPN53675.1 MFS transporter [Anaerolineaceae bacterium]
MKVKIAPQAILFLSLVIVMLGFGIAIPLMPFFVTHFGVSAGALGLMMSLYSLMQFIFAPMWGQISDRVGRKPILLVGVIGYFIAFVLQGLSQDFYQLMISRTLAGILTSASLPTAMAYMVDITEEKDRSKGVGLMGAAMGVGMIFGPMVGGLLTKLSLPLPEAITGLVQVTQDAATGDLINLSIPFFASAILALLAVPLIVLCLPESLVKERRRQQPAAVRESRVRQLISGLKGPIGFLYIMAFLLAFALANMESVLGMYGQQHFTMSPAEVGLMMGAIGVLSVIQQGVVIGPLTRKLGEIKVVRGGLLISMIGFVLLALAFSKWALIVAALVFNFGNTLLQPSITAMVSKRAQGGQGAAMGLNNSFQSLGRATGPLWAGFAYDIYATLSFWTGALIQLVALIYSLRVLGEVAGSVPEEKPRLDLDQQSI